MLPYQSSVIAALQHKLVSNEEIRDMGHRPPDQGNFFSEPKLLHLPIPRKVLNSLTGDIGFSFITSNLLFSLRVVIAKIPVYPGIYTGFTISFSNSFI